MFDTPLRHLKEKIAAPIAHKLCAHIHPTALSIVACLCGIGACWALYGNANATAFGLWIASRILDGLDGTVARIHHKKSAIGGYIDLMLDAIVYTLFPIAIAINARSTPIYIATILLLGAYYFNALSWTLLSALFERTQNRPSTERPLLTSMRMPAGLIEGFETVIIYALLCILPPYRLHIMLITAILTAIGACGRIIWAIRARQSFEE